MTDPETFDPYEDDLDQFHPSLYKGGARRKPRPKRRKRTAEVTSERIAIAGRLGVSEGRSMTYRPAKFEAVWLRESLTDFFDQELISDVLAQVKGGKEATVYRCEAGVATEHQLVAVKVYRPRQFRNLANDAVYRQGRTVMMADGREMTKHDERIGRALHKRTEFGAQVRHTSWLMYEYTTIEKLFAAGLDVPEPIAASDNAILMEYIGDRDTAAPTLREVRIPREQARPLFDRVMENVEVMLQWGVIHGDLSAYNLLYWEGNVTIIDFPQVIDPHENPDAFDLFVRDVSRICEYFARYGVEADAGELAAQMWSTHVVEDAIDHAADLSQRRILEG